MSNLKYVTFPDKVDESEINPLDKTILGAENINQIKEAINTNADVLLEVKSSIPTKLSDLENDLNLSESDAIKEEVDPTVPSWAKAANKPIYDYSEIKNTPVIPNINGLASQEYVLNSIKDKANKDELLTVISKISFTNVNDCLLYSFSDENLKNAMITSITINTLEGEILLPYYNENGIIKIYRKNNKFYFQLGNNVESFTNGNIYLSQLVSSKNNSDLSIIVDAVIEKTSTVYYGTVMPLDETYVSITMINDTMLNDSTNNVSSVELNNIQNPITLLNCPIGSYIFVLIPYDSSLAAYKDDGFGNSVDFDKNIGLENSGSTGSLVTIDNKQYKVYGELNLNDNSTNIIYIK